MCNYFVCCVAMCYVDLCYVDSRSVIPVLLADAAVETDMAQMPPKKTTRSNSINGALVFPILWMFA